MRVGISDSLTKTSDLSVKSPNTTFDLHTETPREFEDRLFIQTRMDAKNIYIECSPQNINILIPGGVETLKPNGFVNYKGAIVCLPGTMPKIKEKNEINFEEYTNGKGGIKIIT